MTPEQPLPPGGWREESRAEKQEAGTHPLPSDTGCEMGQLPVCSQPLLDGSLLWAALPNPSRGHSSLTGFPTSVCVAATED